MIDFQVAYDKLASMETADEIAEYFRDCGIKACPGAARGCAISVWMQEQTGLETSTNPMSMRPLVGYNPVTMVLDYAAGPRLRLTQVMRDFITAFDLHDYPDLLDDQHHCLSCDRADPTVMRGFI